MVHCKNGMVFVCEIKTVYMILDLARIPWNHSTVARWVYSHAGNFFHCCILSIICRDPLISPSGYIFDKESILTYIVQQKKEYKRKMKLWEQQNKNEAEEAEQKAKLKEEENKKNFVAFEMGTPRLGSETPSTSGSVI